METLTNITIKLGITFGWMCIAYILCRLIVLIVKKRKYNYLNEWAKAIDETGNKNLPEMNNKPKRPLTKNE